MLYIILFIIVISIFFLPQWWVKYVMKRYSKTINALPGTGGELAQHLIDQYQLPVTLEATNQGDHYDPQSKTVRLSPEYLNGKSLTAIAIAAHEVGHAVQDYQKDELLLLRGKMVTASQRFQKLGAGIIFIAPLMTAFTHSPLAGIIFALIGFMSIASSVVVHFISLPVEFDASFNKALPLLKEGNYVTKRDLIAVRQVLLAAALTYVAAALAGLLNVWRWIALLRR
ncbi:MAG: zinc metallopeptidase [gamma proteobacterium symbiont of Bathyaustriella thionipta]|nr:zinc metallopeptidase [gamma proteobacterium symbiont of Bathyaustriella thionipta]MCU7950462.1 zinc metallopeptidase [gamma proteobacterium symbiont of Bathyaustriella thionipta]MCU7953270.1 zinc metallopeptidase [gamma proteobacterium symbiont of Bathyaustriella thionipta]MCU7957252.1 zinc metallopeptidase [gamma proteobacterium symbiont of Bathyaustriella thionipta]MCU7966522.1 zinc metallopeptidase [gamma proteobacterium symbiont of Bathyaustriella thionipta]